MTNIISALFITFSSLVFSCMLLVTPAQALEQAAKPLGMSDIKDDAPDRHIVVPGDTLWGIAAKFLKEPYRWPEIWRLNQEQIKSPHRIYPGQVVILDKSGEQPQLKLGKQVKAEPRIYVDEDKREIPSIPQQAIKPFLSEPLVVDAGVLDSAPRIIGSQEERVNIGAGTQAYVTGIDAFNALATRSSLPKPKLWHIYRQGQALIDPDKALPDDPDKKEMLGYEAVFLGSARVVRDGEPATIDVVSSRLEISRGDRLLPADTPDIINYAPHAPSKDFRGRVISVYGGVGVGGNYSIVTLSRGKKNGLEIGHVLAIYRAGELLNIRHEGEKESYQIPDERYGFLFVFRVFDRVSYALVMDVTRPVTVYDVVRAP